MQKNIEKQKIANPNIFSQYLPSYVQQQHLQIYRQLSLVTTRPQLRDMYKLYKRYLLTEQKSAQKSIIVTYLQTPIIAEGILGHIDFKFLSLQLIRAIGSDIAFQKMVPILKRMVTVEQFRNMSQIIESISHKYRSSEQIFQYFTLPLLNMYKQAVQKIQPETFSCKWLQVLIEIVRSVNNLIKFVNCQQFKTQIIDWTNRALEHTSVLRRDIITQLYIILVTMNSEQAAPAITLNLIHYLYAKSIVYNEPILEKLLSYTTITETQTKYHLLYALSYSMEKQYQAYHSKEVVFNKIIELYEVGRTSYNLLEDIIKVILKSKGQWHISGYLARKFFIAKCILKSIENYKQVETRWPTLLQESLQYAGNLNTPFAIDCVQILLEKAYQHLNKNPELWTQFWIKPYLKCLLEGSRSAVRGIIEQVNPIITRLCKKPVLLQHLINLEESSNIKLGIISLLKCYKQNGLISADQQTKSYKYKSLESTSIQIQYNKILELLLANDTNVALKSFEFLTLTQKSSQILFPFEYELIFEFFKYCLRTSSSEYRRSYINTVRKYFQRLRTIYEKHISPLENKKLKEVKYFQQFRTFIERLTLFCFQSIYPEVPFQIINPLLELLHLIFSYFGVYQYQIRKGTILNGSNLLTSMKSVFTLQNFNSIVVCLQSSFENVRNLAFNIMHQFPLDFTSAHEIVRLWKQSIELTNKLVIKQFESGARLIGFIFMRYDIAEIQTKYALKQLNLYYFLYQLVKQRFEIFKTEFSKQVPQFHKNLVHGLATGFSYLFQHLSTNIRLKPEHYIKYLPQIKAFFEKLFRYLKEIIIFAVQISSANVSTVVLDSSQSKLADLSANKMKVDCRGHFIVKQDKQKQDYMKNIENMLSGTTLMTSISPEEDQNVENTLVVSFYLLTRQTGLLFQSIGSLVQADKIGFLPHIDLVDIINTYFYALVNLKHMGSVDRISQGLEKMSKAIYKKQNNQLTALPETLLMKLLELLEQSKFTNILRRSAGIPYAFTCLLKSEALKRKQLVDHTMNKLFFFARNDNEEIKELRIHAFNILKKLFQDADLKFDLDPFVSEAFSLAIKAFSTQQWGVRNSSLMLFSTLSLRTLGMKPKLNLLQFFQKCPSLIGFFLEQLKSYIKIQTMYPPIYPIALLLSRLVPFDKGSTSYNLDTVETESRQLHRQELNVFIPLLVQASNTSNYMGRVIIGKALLPFMQLGDIQDFCMDLLKQLELKSIKKNHNKAHSTLLIIYHLLRSYFKIINQQQHQSTQFDKKSCELLIILSEKIKLLEKIRCPLVQQMIVKITFKLLKHRHLVLKSQLPQVYQQLVNFFLVYSDSYLEQNVFKLNKFKFEQDFGDSMLRLSIIKLYLRCHLIFSKSNLKPFLRFLGYILKESSQNHQFFEQLDNQIAISYLKELRRYCKLNKQSMAQSQQLKQTLKQLAFCPSILSSTTVLTNILGVLKYFKPSFTKPQIDRLLSIENTTDPYLKLSIFKILYKTGNKVIKLFSQYSQPDQLISFRVACVRSIKQFDPQCAIIYIRLLEDEDSQIRKYTAEQLSICLKISQYNQNKMIQILMKELDAKHIQFIIDDGDLQTKKKNQVQERIFSYDKANKYRSDIYNIIKIVQKITKEHRVVEQSSRISQIIAQYTEQIFTRNQYKFEVILRQVIHQLVNNHPKPQILKRFGNLDPILNKLITQYA